MRRMIGITAMIAVVVGAVMVLGSGSRSVADEPAISPDSIDVTFKVLLYFDGSSELIEVYEQAVLGFSEDPACEVVQVFDPDEFQDALLVSDVWPELVGTESELEEGQVPYDSYVAITVNSTVAMEWAEDVGFKSNYFAFFPDPIDEGQVRMEIVVQESEEHGEYEEAEPVVPEGAAASQADDDLVRTFRLWWSIAKDETIDFLSWLLNFVADLLEGLEHTTVSIEFEGSVDTPLAKGRVKLTVKTTGEDAAILARRLAGKLQELK